MKLFDVYPVYPINPVKAKGAYLWDEKGKEYLDFYGGHAVISIGHSHPHYVEGISNQLKNIGFYSNSVLIPQQEQLATALGKASGLEDFQLFLCNSGAEAVENALKVASFHTERKKILSFKESFHGRTSLAVEVTSYPKMKALVNHTGNVAFADLNDIEWVEKELSSGDYAAVIIEGIQGFSGINVPEESFLIELRNLCTRFGTMLILDEIQSGYGRTGDFFAFQNAGIIPDIVTIAKGMGNGFPIAGVLLKPEIQPKHGMLGTTFGGNHLACAAGIAVLEVIETEHLVENSKYMGEYLIEKLRKIDLVKSVRGRGLMIGMEFDFPAADLRKKLLTEYNIFTGSSGNQNVMRLLPPLCVTKEECDRFLEAFENILANEPFLQH